AITNYLFLPSRLKTKTTANRNPPASRVWRGFSSDRTPPHPPCQLGQTVPQASARWRERCIPTPVPAQALTCSRKSLPVAHRKKVPVALARVNPQRHPQRQQGPRTTASQHSGGSDHRVRPAATQTRARPLWTAIG